ncbi:putative cathepsin F [Helianthus annuus]|nr:putative cathepsin F [Helianthus annuus]
MDPRLSLVAFSLFIAGIFVASFVSAESKDYMLIRQVIGDENHQLNDEYQFGAFKSKFGKSYASQEEHDYRLSVFKANLRRAKRYQKLDPSAVHGVTQFSDEDACPKPNMCPRDGPDYTRAGIHSMFARTRRLRGRAPVQARPDG